MVESLRVMETAKAIALAVLTGRVAQMCNKTGEAFAPSRKAQKKFKSKAEKLEHDAMVP